MAGIIEVKDQGKLRIYDADNSHYIDIVVPSSVTANRTITIPDASFTVPQANTEYSVGDGGLTTNNFTDADHSKLNGIAASANNYVHPNHSGEVTSSADGATVIADNIVDEANLKVSNSAVNGYMLTAQSGNTGGLTWAEAGGGAWNLLSTVTASDDSRIDCTLSGSYSNYAIILSGVTPVSDNVQMLVRMGTASTANDTGSNYRYICASSLDDGSTNTYQSQGEDKGKISGVSLGNAAGESLEATIHIGHDSDHQNSTRLNILSAHTDNAGSSCTNNACVVYNPRVAVTKVNFFMAGGNVNYGIFKIYGIS